MAGALDAAELAQLPQFLSVSLAREPGPLSVLLEDFTGHPGYDIMQLRQDVSRFVVLLGGSDGEPLFGP